MVIIVQVKKMKRRIWMIYNRKRRENKMLKIINFMKRKKMVKMMRVGKKNLKMMIQRKVRKGPMTILVKAILMICRL